MLKIVTRNEGNSTSIELCGRLAGPWVEQLRSCWIETAAARPAHIEIALKDVTFIDPAGKALLADMHRTGARLAASGCMIRAIIEEITRREAERQGAAEHGRDE